MKMPDFGECSETPVDETFRDLFYEIASIWAPCGITEPKGLLREYQEYIKQFEDRNVSSFDGRYFGKRPNENPFDLMTKRLVVQLHFRRKNRHGFKIWFRKFLKRPYLPVLKLENDIEYADERGKYGSHINALRSCF